MATKQELLDKVAQLKADQEQIRGLMATLASEVSAAFGRFLAKLAAGEDTQPIIDELNSIGGINGEIKTAIESLTAQAQIEGQ